LGLRLGDIPEIRTARATRGVSRKSLQKIDLHETCVRLASSFEDRELTVLGDCEPISDE